MRCNISVSGAVLAADRAAQQLDNAAQLVGVCYVLEGDLGDALNGHIVDGHGGVEAEGGHDGGLVGSIVAFDVAGRVGFGVALAWASLSTSSNWRPLVVISSRM